MADIVEKKQVYQESLRERQEAMDRIADRLTLIQERRKEEDEKNKLADKLTKERKARDEAIKHQFSKDHPWLNADDPMGM
jgi:hypothetical protein